MIKNFKPRLYQQTILASASKKNTLVVLPTGLGKTSIALLLAAHRLSTHPASKVLVLAPTKPLVEQIGKVFSDHLDIPAEKIATVSGLVQPEKRQLIFTNSKVIVSTPQGFENDIIAGRIPLADVSLLVFDEAHRAVKDYSYVWIAKQYQKTARFPLILGLTASPGSDAEKIKEVCGNLFIENIEVRTDEDPDVKPYVQEVEMSFVTVELPPRFKSVKKYLEDCFNSKLREARELGVVDSRNINALSKRDILGMQAQLHSEVAHGNKDLAVLRSISLLAEALKVQHALELLETQGVPSLLSYMQSIASQASTSKIKAVQNLARDLNFRSALALAENLASEGFEHPKLTELVRLIERELSGGEKRIIVFNHYRDNAKRIVEALSKISKAKPMLFVGQAKKKGTGMSQKEQLKVLEEFRNGKYNILVMTSVGEEGIDIPSVDIVVFYEPIPSAIRHIQRRGRTGRLEKGRVVILVTKGTRDEAYRWSAHHKEKSMHNVLRKIKKESASVMGMENQPTLSDFSNNEKKSEEFHVRVIVDPREKGNPLVKALIDMGAEVSLQRLDSADYMLSPRVAVEHKTVQDFVDSIVDGRILSQLKALRESYQNPVIVIEGDEDIYSVRNVHPNAIRGMLATIAVSYSIPLIHTKNFRDTASLLLIMARREQDETTRVFQPHSTKPRTKREMQEYVVSALPGVGGTLARPLLSHFKSINKLFNASVKELKEVELIGEKKARAIRDIIDSEYVEE